MNSSSQTVSDCYMNVVQLMMDYTDLFSLENLQNFNYLSPM
jgi:hypothetical protein